MGGRDGDDKMCRETGVQWRVPSARPQPGVCSQGGKAGWQVGGQSPRSFDQQVSPGCEAVSRSVHSLCILVCPRVLHPSPPPTPLLPAPLLPFLISHLPQEAGLSGEPSAAGSQKHCLVLSQRCVPCLGRQTVSGWGSWLLPPQLGSQRAFPPLLPHHSRPWVWPAAPPVSP